MSFKRAQVRKENFIKKLKGSVDRTLERHQRHDFKVRKEELELTSVTSKDVRR
jgi:hypothetical protein